ncbi:hypothetical protein V8E36_000971 [Tilletia maclaganii]
MQPFPIRVAIRELTREWPPLSSYKAIVHRSPRTRRHRSIVPRHPRSHRNNNIKLSLPTNFKIFASTHHILSVQQPLNQRPKPKIPFHVFSITLSTIFKRPTHINERTQTRATTTTFSFLQASLSSAYAPTQPNRCTHDQPTDPAAATLLYSLTFPASTYRARRALYLSSLGVRAPTICFHQPANDFVVVHWPSPNVVFDDLSPNVIQSPMHRSFMCPVVDLVGAGTPSFFINDPWWVPYLDARV